MKRIGWMLLAASPVGCAPPSNAADPAPSDAVERVTDRTELGGRAAELVARDGGCLLRRVGAADVPLAPAAPCRFLRAGGEVQREAYPDRGVDAVVMVVGSPADAATRAEYGAADAGACGTAMQGLAVRGQDVSASRRPLRDGLFCADKGRDEKDFYAVAHEGDAGPGRR